MTSRDIILENMKSQGITNKALAERLGYLYASGVSERLRGSNSMKIDVLLKFLDVLDCDLVVRQRENNQEWVIGDESENKIKPQINHGASSEEKPKSKTRVPSPKPLDLDALLNTDESETQAPHAKDE